MDCPEKKRRSQTARVDNPCAGKRAPGTFFVIERGSLKALRSFTRSATILVYLELASMADDEGRCWPSLTHLSDKCDRSRSSVKRAVVELESRGLVTVTSGKGCKSTSLYQLQRMGPAMSLFEKLNGSSHEPPMGPAMHANGASHEPSNGSIAEPLNENHRNENQERDSLNEKKSAARAACSSVLFDDFWKVYPRKAAKEDARKAFRKAIESESAEAIIGAATEFAGSPKGQGDYCPYPATWLRRKSWLDDRAAWNTGSATNSRRGAGAVYNPQASERNPNHGKF